jgi:hypothetical protein
MATAVAIEAAGKGGLASWMPDQACTTIALRDRIMVVVSAQADPITRPLIAAGGWSTLNKGRR